MATVLETLKGINAYPIPGSTIRLVVAGRELYPDDEVGTEVLRSREFNLAKADLLMWLATAPNISQGGQNYSFSDEQRNQFRRIADCLYRDFDYEEPRTSKPIYGYKGNRL